MWQLERSNDPIKKANVDLHLIIEEAISHIQLILADKNGKVNKQLNAKEFIVFGNKNHLTNIIVDLLDNALKYCEEKPEIFIKTFTNENQFVIEITDNGIGMNPSTQKKVFDKFYRVSHGNVHNVKGLGLGLYYTSQIVNAHQGKITVQSELHKGTTFTILIPIN